MKLHRWEDMKRRKLSPEKLEKIDQEVEREVLLLNLKALREELGKTQSEIAAMADMDQSEVSKAERRGDHLVSTLRRYVAAAGGELEIFARVGKKRIRLQGV